MTMLPIILRLSWLLLSFAVTCIAIPIGYAVAWGTTAALNYGVVLQPQASKQTLRQCHTARTTHWVAAIEIGTVVKEGVNDE